MALFGYETLEKYRKADAEAETELRTLATLAASQGRGFAQRVGALLGEGTGIGHGAMIMLSDAHLEDRGGGAAVALDDLELSSSLLLLARQLLPAYVKLAPTATRDLATQADSRYLVESVVALLRPLEIAVLAKGVENESDIAVLEACGVSGFQGYASSRPAPLRI